MLLLLTISNLIMTLFKNKAPGVVGQTQVTAHHMLQEARRRLFGELQDHFALK